MATLDETLSTKLERVRKLLHRLAHVRNDIIEASLIAELTVETEAVRQVRALIAHGSPTPSPSLGPAGLTIDFASDLPVGVKASASRTRVRPRLAPRTSPRTTRAARKA